MNTKQAARSFTQKKSNNKPRKKKFVLVETTTSNTIDQKDRQQEYTIRPNQHAQEQQLDVEKKLTTRRNNRKKRYNTSEQAFNMDNQRKLLNVQKQIREQAKKDMNRKKRFMVVTTNGSSVLGAFTSRGTFDQLKQEESKPQQQNNLLRKQKTLPEQMFDNLTERLIYTLINQTHECVICFENIKRHVATWSCSHCYGVFHLNCIRKWATESMKERSNNNNNNNNNNTWICPCCQSINVQTPNTYYCFCKKHIDPSPDPFLVPHSCGEICAKRRTAIDPKCPHPCNLQCHPGPCPPCIAMRDEDCYCGKITFEVQCNDIGTKGISCEQQCQKSLNCRRHFCTEICHAGTCQPCELVYEQVCYCGKRCEKRKCEPCPTEEKDEESGMIKTFSCGQPCPRTLPCGHICDRLCHEGKCIKNMNEWGNSSECDDNIDEYIALHGCMQQCKKKLPCGHICRRKCHPQTPCITNDDRHQSCKEKVKIFCSCGRLNQVLDCSTVHMKMNEKYPSDTVIDIRSLPPLVECDKECKRIARIKMLAEAFDVDFEKHEMPEYSQALQDFAFKHASFIQTIEQIFDELLFDEKHEFRSYQFKPMPAIKRKVIHELAEIYLMDAQSLDPEPYRSVSVLKTKQSRRPAILLSEVIGNSHKIEILETKRKEKEEEERKRQEMILQDIQKKKEAKLRERETRTLDMDYTEPVYASNEDFDIITLRQAQKTKSARSKKPEEATNANAWNVLIAEAE
jgi:hypothetical protein